MARAYLRTVTAAPGHANDLGEFCVNQRWTGTRFSVERGFEQFALTLMASIFD